MNPKKTPQTDTSDQEKSPPRYREIGDGIVEIEVGPSSITKDTPPSDSDDEEIF
jgi:hypothetical protein